MTGALSLSHSHIAGNGYSMVRIADFFNMLKTCGDFGRSLYLCSAADGLCSNVIDVFECRWLC